MEYKEEIDRLAKEFESCQKILLALGDENRRHLILEMIQMEQCNGVRVGTITEKTHLSRPAISSSAHIRGCRHHPRAAERNKKLLLF